LKKVSAIHYILIAGLMHGLLYVFLIPPWQHYDEPGHFEVAWLMANRPGLPSRGEYDQNMRRELAASMVEHRFFKDLSLQPDLLAQGAPISIGYSQTGDPPIYYWIAALPLRLVLTSDLVFQLHLSRLISLLLYLLTILAAYGIMSELTTPENPARWFIPATLVLIPGFTELMTAVNSDVGAVAFFSLFLWASIRMIQRGFSLLRLAAVILCSAACFWTKNTAAIALPLIVFPILFSMLRGHRQPVAWAALGACLPIIIFVVFTSGDVAFWYQPTPQITHTRLASAQAPLGTHVFQLDASSGTNTNNLMQFLPYDQVQKLRGKAISLGYWIWANQPIKFHSPLIISDQKTYSESVDVTQTPTFHAFTMKITGNTRHLQIVLVAPPKTGIYIYLDGLILLKGDYTQSGKPVLLDDGGHVGTWQGKSFVNPIRNASAEQDWPRPRSMIQILLDKITPLRPNLVLASLADWQNSRWYYQTTAKQLIRTFWGQFGWGHIRLPRSIYIALSILMGLSALGAMLGLWRNRKRMSWPAFGLMAVAVLGIWGAALVRGIQSIAGYVFIPSARYAYPAIIPTVLVLCAGWAEWPQLFKQWFPIPRWVKVTLFLACFLALDILSVWTIAHFYGKL
jgi:hypothetical protein